jgi:uncharacterized phage protein gp47/JayE
MSFVRPDLSTLIERATQDIETRLPGADARLRRSNLAVLARVNAGAVHGLYGYLDWISRQALPDTADAEQLDRWAAIWRVTRKSAAFAAGAVTVTGSAGAVVPAGAELQSADGQVYLVDSEVSLAGSSDLVDCTASTSGQAGNLDAGTALSFVSPISGVNNAAVVAAGGLVGGADVESDDDLRSRLLERIQQPPQGGAEHDYLAWALEVPGVTRAWVYPGELGAGTVTVRFVRDDDASQIPDAGEVATVQTYIDERRPVTADVTVAAPVAVALALTISITPDTATIRAAVTAELTDLLLREAEPGGTILLSHLREAISLAAGETDHDLVSPVADVTHTTGQMAVLGTITWA